MSKKIIAGGCSFTLGNELSDDVDGKTPSKKSWSALLVDSMDNAAVRHDYVCSAFGGLGNPAIARRVFQAVSTTDNVGGVSVMWSFHRFVRAGQSLSWHHLLIVRPDERGRKDLRHAARDGDWLL